MYDTGLEKGSFASPNANHFRGRPTGYNCESHWTTDSQYFWVNADTFGRLRIAFINGFTKRYFFLFLVVIPFLSKFYTIRSKSAN